ncbi:MAG: hypothetical protein IT353_11095 [Gemmatimonadaceae bacterium]|nr:hypothetical protein [Gemmatimonadaceae bacterium]
MNVHSGFRMPRFTRRPTPVRQAAAQSALALCASADAAAREAESVVGVDDDRLFSLLEQRDEMLSDLAEQLVVLRAERPTADSPLYAATEKAVDEADDLIAEVCAALNVSQRVTMELASRVARRAAEIRAELDAVQRAGSAGVGYATLSNSHLVDSRR